MTKNNKILLNRYCTADHPPVVWLLFDVHPPTLRHLGFVLTSACG